MKKEEYIKIINEYIKYFSGNVPIDKYRRKQLEKNDNEEIIKEIYKELPKKCKEYINGDINASMIKEYASNLLYKKYNPNILRDTLSDEVYDFLMLLDEFLFFREEE